MIENQKKDPLTGFSTDEHNEKCRILLNHTVEICRNNRTLLRRHRPANQTCTVCTTCLKDLNGNNNNVLKIIII